MIFNLFSIFDPCSSVFFINNWISLFLFLLFFPLQYYLFNNRINFLFKKIFLLFFKDFKNNVLMKDFSVFVFIVSVFVFIVSINLFGLIPYCFTPSSHLSVTIFFCLPLWLSFMIFGWFMKMNSMFTHLVPLGTPMMLSFFMVFIETISNLIRPITLSVRLAANMIAGHLLIHLLSDIPFSNPLFFLPSSFFFFSLIFLETAVAIIQGYVFVTLLSLYFSEISYVF